VGTLPNDDPSEGRQSPQIEKNNKKKRGKEKKEPPERGATRKCSHTKKRGKTKGKAKAQKKKETVCLTHSIKNGKTRQGTDL